VNHQRTENDSEYAVQVHGDFSYGVAPVKDKAEKDELISKLKEADKKLKEEADKKRWSVSKFIEKLQIQRDKQYEIELKPRSLNDIIALSDIHLDIKKGDLVIVIGKIQAGKTSLLKAMVGEMLNIPASEVDFIGDKSRKIGEGE
jgi:ATPase subunit of ABC transporter with duplicated ATPase domains